MNKSILVLIAFMLTGLFSFKCNNDESNQLPTDYADIIEVDDFIQYLKDSEAKHYKVIEVDVQNLQIILKNKPGSENKIISFKEFNESIKERKIKVFQKGIPGYIDLVNLWEAGKLDAIVKE